MAHPNQFFLFRAVGGREELVELRHEVGQVPNQSFKPFLIDGNLTKLPFGHTGVVGPAFLFLPKTEATEGVDKLSHSVLADDIGTR